MLYYRYYTTDIMIKSNTMKKKYRHGMKVITSIHQTSKIKTELILKCNRRETNMNRKKYKKMITTELPERFQKKWRKKYHKIVNERTNHPSYSKRYRTLKAKKKSLKQVKVSFSNNDFIPYNNPYVRHKFSEKDKENDRLKKHLKDIEYQIRHNLCHTYQGKCKSGEHAFQLHSLLKKLDEQKETRTFRSTTLNQFEEYTHIYRRRTQLCPHLFSYKKDDLIDDE